MHITTKQIKIARIALDWTQPELAAHAGVSKDTIVNMETGKTAPRQESHQKVVEALQAGGIEFLDDNGVRERRDYIHRFEGLSGFKDFIDDVYGTVKDEGGHVYVTNVDERQFERWQDVHADDYLSKMAEVKNLEMRILVKEGDDYHTASKYAKYRYIPEKYFGAMPTYIYGNKVAEILFGKDNVTIYLLENKEIADARRKTFLALWENAQG